MRNKTPWEWTAARIKTRREELHWDQRILGEKVGVHAMTVGCWERGVQVPSLRHLRKLDRVLG